MANITGWGRGTWNELAWDSPIPVVVTGVSGTSELGNEFFTGDVNASVTGLVALNIFSPGDILGTLPTLAVSVVIFP